MNPTNFAQAPVSAKADFLPLFGTDYIEFYVGNAKQAAHYYQSAFGFQALAYSGPETGTKDKVSYAVRQDRLTFVFTTALRPNHPIADHVAKHGDGVRVIALTVKDAKDAYKQTIDRGADTYLEPKRLTDIFGHVELSGIKLYGDTVHVFVERKDYTGVFMPGYRKWESEFSPMQTGLKYVDHCVANVGWNAMNYWVKFYEEVMGFQNILSFDDNDISTEYSALMSKVMSSGNGFVKFPINEPAEGKKKSQVEEYLEFYRGEGVQHIALGSDDIVRTVTALRKNGVEFLSIPSAYYENLLDRVGTIDENLAPLKELGILVDRPTLFFEIIQRKGAKSFGKGNFQALFEAIEREQEQRGNL